MFVRAGSFIPQYMRKMENVGDYDPKYLTVKYFPGSEASSYTLFDDDRRNPESLQEGAYQLTEFKATPEAGGYDFTVSSEGRYKGMPESRLITLEIEQAGRPADVTVDGKKIPETGKGNAVSEWRYDTKERRLSVTFEYSYQPTPIKVRR